VAVCAVGADRGRRQLGSRRSYKEPWPLEQILDDLRQQRGAHFDPAIVDWVLGNVDEMVAVSRICSDAPH